MAKHGRYDKKNQTIGPSQRQLRAGELIRHALVEVLREREINDEALVGVSVTLTQVRMSPDLRHAICFVEPLGAGVGPNARMATAEVKVIVKALNKHAKFLRGVLGRQIDMKFTPDLKFVHDDSFDAASKMNALFEDPRVKQDLDYEDEEPDELGVLSTDRPTPPREGGDA